MALNSSIEWTQSTWNPITGCTKISAGCQNCYAEGMAKLLARHYDPTRAIGRFKKFALYFSANFRFGHSFYSKILGMRNMAETEDIIRRFFKTPPELTSRPNMNFFR